MFSTRKKLLFFIALTGTAVKLAEFLLWYGSTFRFYNLVPGLDMKTLLSFSEWGTPGNGFFLTPHRALVAAWWKLNGSTHFIPGIVAVQALCGILGATLCADLALRLFDRDRTAAIVCGLAYLLYGPFFIYEFSVLQETTALTLILFAFHAALRARGVRRCALAGAVLGLSVVGRPIALPLASFLCLLILKREVRRGDPSRTGRCAAALFGSGAAVLLAVSLVNLRFGGNGNVFFRVLPYTLEFNSSAAASGGTTAGDPYLRLAVNAVSRVPRLFLPLELPENLNWYFIAETLPPLRLLVGPALLMPLAAAGLLFAIPRFRRRAGLLLPPLLALALPLCARDPIGRYRIILVPYFILCAGYWLHLLTAMPRRRRILPAAAALLCFALELPTLHPYRRGSDYLTHALALELENGGNSSAESLRYLASGWKKSGFKNNPLGINLYLRLLKTDDAAALGVLKTGTTHSPVPEPYLYYLALREADRGNFTGAEALLRSCRPERLGALKGKYFYLYGEMLRRRGETDAARMLYSRSLENLEPGSSLASRVKESLRSVSASPAAR